MQAHAAQSVVLLGRLRAPPATKRQGFGLANLCIPEEPAEDDATPLRVKNTFIEPLLRRTPSLENFFSEREVQTCPGSQVGRLEGLFQEEGPLPPTPKAEGPPSVGPAEGGDAGCWDRTPTPLAHAGPSEPLWPVSLLPEPLWPAALLPDAGLHWVPGLPEYVWPAAAGHGHPEYAWPAAAGPGAPLWAPPPPAAVPPQPLQDCPCAYVTASGALAAGGFYGAAPGLPLSPPAPMPTAMAHVAAPQAPPSAAAPPVVAALAPAPAPRAAPGEAVPAPPSGPAPGSAELPSVGSALHGAGLCRPCAFLGTKGCTSGVVCSFCHLCEPGEKKRRSKEKLAGRRVSTVARAL